MGAECKEAVMLGLCTLAGDVSGLLQVSHPHIVRSPA